MLEREDVASSVLYPSENDEKVDNAWQAKWPFLIVLTMPDLVEIAQQWGHCIVGLNGLYKAMKHRLPLYTLVANDEEGHAWLMSCDTSEVLAHFLEVVQRHVRGEWAPTIMINKDATEHAAVQLIGWEFVLCDFHVQQAWCWATTQYCKKGRLIKLFIS
jgi:hypothetical protein